MRRRHKVTGGVALAAILPLGLVALPADAAPSDSSKQSQVCAVERLPLMDGQAEGQVYLGDPTGRYLFGIASGWAGTYMLWVDGEPEPFQGPSPTTAFTITDINSSGEMSGYEYGGEEGSRAFRYADGEFDFLPPPVRRNAAEGLGINERGDIVGTGFMYDAPPKPYLPVYWPADDPDKVRVLEQPDPESELIARDIADNGAVIGIRSAGARSNGYLWADIESAPQRLLDPSGSRVTNPTSVTGNVAVGTGKLQSNGDRQGLTWDLETGKQASFEKDVDLVNAAGAVAFEEFWPPRILRSDGTSPKLAALVGDRARDVTAVFDPNNDLVAAGSAKDEDGDWQPVTWHSC